MSQGVRNKNTQCTPCQPNEYQKETREDIQLNLNNAGKLLQKTPIFLGNLQLYLGTSYQKCPLGFEFCNWKNFERGGSPKEGQCRSSNPILDCCRICGNNQISADGILCKNVDPLMSTDNPFGATVEFGCDEGTQLVYCANNGQCSSKSHVGWRTYKPCYGTEDCVLMMMSFICSCRNKI